jgi:polyhydroxyalkanoate synthesis repressor PhaR
LLHCSINLSLHPGRIRVKIDQDFALQQEASLMKKSTVVIRKYENRRLYDTSASRYINLEDVARMIRGGVDFEVVDAKTGEDLTRVVLTQIIVEDAKGQPAGLPLEFLRQLILATDRAGQEFIMWYLKAAFDAYHKVQDVVQSGLSDVRAAAMSPFQTVRNLLTPAKTEPMLEVEELRRRVAELEGRLAERPKARAPRNGAKPRGREAGKSGIREVRKPRIVAQPPAN